MISDLYDKTVSVSRQAWTTDVDGNRYSEEAVVTSFPGRLQQQTSLELAENLGLSFGKVYTLWCAIDADVSEGDALTIDGEAYAVRAVGERTGGINTHLEVTLEQR